MKDEKRIYCIEGQWNWGEEYAEPSVEPILQMLHGLSQWPYVRRDCATVGELNYWIENEWHRHCCEGSVLYFATHGAPWQISLAENSSVISVADLKVDCEKCWVHFGGCRTLDVSEDAVRTFMTETGATVVSGYVAEVGWTDITWPAAGALELMLFSSAHAKGVKVGHKSSRPKLLDIACDLKSRFKDCGFKLHTQESIGL